VIECVDAIDRAWKEVGADRDCGPPDPDELSAGRLGKGPWKRYWNEFHRRSGAIAGQGRPWVLNPDIENCAGEIDADRLADVLAGLGAPTESVQDFARMHQAWRRHGFPGLPVCGTFSLLTRAWLLDVERCLQARGFEFLRSIDDFRLFCASTDEQDDALDALTTCLNARGMRLNPAKSRFERFGTPQSTSRRWRLIFRGKGRYGYLRPVLVWLVSHGWARRASVSVLAFMAWRSENRSRRD
jgi:hypothetical protein